MAKQKLEGKVQSVLRQDWMESERGWGTRPDGCSLHIDYKSHTRFLEIHWGNRQQAYVPDEYSLPDGQPYWVNVNHGVYEKLVKRKNEHGIWSR